MKQVAVIYRNRDNQEVIGFLEESLQWVFEDYVQVQSYFLDEIPQNKILRADAFIVSHNDMLYPLKQHIDNFYKIVLMNRSINRKYLKTILDIPQDTDVLVVNDSYESSVETAYTFYELGIGHVNFIPYEVSRTAAGLYDSISIAVTPRETGLVPPHIPTVIDIGYREISFDTLLKLKNKLDLDLDVINRNLILHMHSVVEANTDFHSNYVDSYLKSEMLNRVIRHSPSAILVLNEAYQLVYSNDQAKTIFALPDDTPCEIAALLDESSVRTIRGADCQNLMVCLQGENYLMDKSSILLMDQVMGYCLTLQNEKDLRQLEINLNSHLQKSGLYAKYRFPDIIHRSTSMEQCLETAKKAAITNYTVLIRGESGTGKELFAQSIHNYSLRKRGPFVAVNCAALPESLLESELFGYEGGAFTGAQKNGKLGLFEQARTGTIFLDEVGDISAKLQSRLLRAIQERQIMRIGSDKIIDIDVRIIAATNKDLEEQVRQGTFRSDLFYRLNVIPLIIPPLRQRKEDILPLFQNFLGASAFSSLREDEKNMLLSYDWPGNVRELESSAVYYKTLSQFPALKCEQTLQPSGPEETVSKGRGDMALAILALILQHSQAFHGIGRAAMISCLKEQGLLIGDGKLREMLSGLENQGLITVGRGRCGSQITLKGMEYLQQSGNF